MRKCEVANMKALKLNKTTRRNYLTYLLVILAAMVFLHEALLKKAEA